MQIEFYKYHGAGNDFVLIDNREGNISLTTEQIASLCDRHLGIGGDGLMLLETIADYDFYMRYYNADGSEVGMCGNGGRCISLFAHHLGVGETEKKFMAKDGEHYARIISDNGSLGLVEVKLIDILDIDIESNEVVTLNSGVPHYVRFTDDIDAIDIMAEGSAVRYSPKYEPRGGINANFVTAKDGKLYIRTYERGVEGETLACGTGATASVVAAYVTKRIDTLSHSIITKGGELIIGFDSNFKSITLTGEAERVFKGIIEL